MKLKTILSLTMILAASKVMAVEPTLSMEHESAERDSRLEPKPMLIIEPKQMPDFINSQLPQSHFSKRMLPKDNLEMLIQKDDSISLLNMLQNSKRIIHELGLPTNIYLVSAVMRVTGNEVALRAALTDSEITNIATTYGEEIVKEATNLKNKEAEMKAAESSRVRIPTTRVGHE